MLPKVTKMGSIIAYRIGHNGVGVPRGHIYIYIYIYILIILIIVYPCGIVFDAFAERRMCKTWTNR